MTKNDQIDIKYTRENGEEYTAFTLRSMTPKELKERGHIEVIGGREVMCYIDHSKETNQTTTGL